MEIRVTINDGRNGKWQKVLKKGGKYIVDDYSGAGPGLYNQDDFVAGITGMILGMLEREEDELAKKEGDEQKRKDGEKFRCRPDCTG